MQKIYTYIYIYAVLVFFGCDENNDESTTVDDLKINQIQVIGSHNSYRINATPEMHGLIASFQPELSLDLDYGHPSLDVQFNQYGIRQIEIDIFSWTRKVGYFIIGEEIFGVACQLSLELKNY
jgi:hypothetical protein